MDSAKAHVKEFLSKSGQHDTTVHETVAPAVTRETVNQHQHENVQTAIDKEVHQDHYHTSVQPVHHREKLAEQHHHNLGAVEHRQFEHDNERDVADRLATEKARFKDEQVAGEVKETRSIAPIVAGEHIHHHVHETIQPVVHKQTIEPHVTHTTVPIHEVHHNAAQHHNVSALPAVSMADFKKQGGVLTGREERYDGFEGEPRSMVGKAEDKLEGHHHSGTTDNTGNTGTTGSTGTTGNTGNTGSTYDNTSSGTNGTTGTKPSLLDRLNPMKDTDGDGKKGVMN